MNSHFNEYAESRMKNTFFTVCTISLGVSLSLGSFADESTQTDKEVAKQTALNICVDKATSLYGKAIVKSKPRRAVVGKLKGYRVELKAGPESKKVTCLVDRDSGESKFYTGYPL